MNEQTSPTSRGFAEHEKAANTEWASTFQGATCAAEHDTDGNEGACTEPVTVAIAMLGTESLDAVTGACSRHALEVLESLGQYEHGDGFTFVNVRQES